MDTDAQLVSDMIKLRVNESVISDDSVKEPDKVRLSVVLTLADREPEGERE